MRFNRDAFRLAASVGVLLLLALLVSVLFGYPFDRWVVIAVPTLVAVLVYVMAVVFILRPLHALAGLLQKIAQRQFDFLPEQMEDAPGRGEIDHLRKAVLTTGRALEKEIGNLKRIESYRRDFLGNVSHELKTPIFAIHGFAETLLDGALDSPEVRVEFVEKILRNSERLDNLANDLSEIAKIETGELKMSPAFFDLEELLVDVVESLESRALQKNISITYRTDPRLKPMFADDGRVRQVLLNLVDNGIKYTNPGGTVLISARLVGEAIKTTVSDSGIGIAAEHIDRLTERFYRVDTSRSRSQGGTGLGLAIVKHILSAHGSRLLVQSKPGYGTTFSFSLPTTDSRSDYNPSSGDLRESTSRQESLRS